MISRANIVTIVLDDAPIDFAEAMPWMTSEVDGSWVTFPRAVVHIPVCNPSRATIFSGFHMGRHGVDSNDALGSKRWVLDNAGTALLASGYQSCLIGKLMNDWPYGVTNPVPIPTGWQNWHLHRSNSTGRYYDYVLFESSSTEVVYGSAEADYSTDVFANRAVSFVEAAAEPFHLYLAPHAPHFEYDVPPRYASTYSTDDITDRPNYNEADVSDKPAWVQAKDFQGPRNIHLAAWRMTRAVDDALEAIRNACVARGIWDRTVVFVLTDNGNLFGEHRLVSKGAPYQEAISSGLRVRWPGHVGGTSDALVSTIDLASTWADIAGRPMSHAPDGMSMAPLLDGSVTAANYRADMLVSYNRGSDPEKPPFNALLTYDPYRKWVELDTGETERYDLEADPYELSNIAGANPALDSMLSAKLATLLAP